MALAFKADVAAKKRLSEYPRHRWQSWRDRSTRCSREAERRDLMSDYEIAKRTTGVEPPGVCEARSQGRHSSDNVRFRWSICHALPTVPSGP